MSQSVICFYLFYLFIATKKNTIKWTIELELEWPCRDYYYGMADGDLNEIRRLAHRLAQPFLHKYSKFGHVDYVMFFIAPSSTSYACLWQNRYVKPFHMYDYFGLCLCADPHPKIISIWRIRCVCVFVCEAADVCFYILQFPFNVFAYIWRAERFELAKVGKYIFPCWKYQLILLCAVYRRADKRSTRWTRNVFVVSKCTKQCEKWDMIMYFMENQILISFQ